MLFISIFLFNWPNPLKDSHGSNRGYFCSSKVANSILVQHFSGNVVPGTICGDPTQRKSTSTTKTKRTAPLVVETNTSDREGVREVFLSQGFDNNTVDILMASWKKSIFSSYFLYMSEWFKFASCNKVLPVERPVQVALTFLTLLVRQGKSFNQICMARSALSSVTNQQQNVSVGNILIVKRYMKGIFENNPTLPKFRFTWNVSLLFHYFGNIQGIHALDTQKLSKLSQQNIWHLCVSLLCITRCQSFVL